MGAIHICKNRYAGGVEYKVLIGHKLNLYIETVIGAACVLVCFVVLFLTR